MASFCSWCDNLMRSVPGATRVTHALCPSCLEDLRESLASDARSAPEAARLRPN